MLNKFKNALYGTSSSNDDSTIAGAYTDYKEAALGRRIRSALTRSSSFREDLLSDVSKLRLSDEQQNSNNNNNNSGTNDVTHALSSRDDRSLTGSSLLRGRSQLLRRSKRISEDDEKQYSNSDQTDQLKGGASTTINTNNNNNNSSSRGHSNENNSRRSIQRIPSGASGSSIGSTRVLKFPYTRPEFLLLKTDDEIIVSADHQIRPIILPRNVSRLPWISGYAECINAGKSPTNEDQAACCQDVAIRRSAILNSPNSNSSPNNNNNSSSSSSILDQIPWTYFGLFDGHAGSAVAVAAAAQLHKIISEKLRHIADLLIALEFDLVEPDESEREINDDQHKDKGDCINVNDEQDKNDLSEKDLQEQKQEQEQEQWQQEADATTRGARPVLSNPWYRNGAYQSNESFLPSIYDICHNKITVESLIKGALESAFWEMDELIARDKCNFRMPGGCAAIVSLFILGKLYVCNAGDCRAIVYKQKRIIPMSFDFTPVSERQRVLRLGMERPDLLGKEFTQLEFLRRPTRKDLGKQMYYRDAYMTGWSLKEITYEDLRFPLVWGEGKRSRVLATIGVTRGFGDHELRAQFGSVMIKPFLTPEPEVRVLDLINGYNDYKKNMINNIANEQSELITNGVAANVNDEGDDVEHLDKATKADVLIMGTDGLWDVASNEQVAEIVERSISPENEMSKYCYVSAAQDLVIHSRGLFYSKNSPWNGSSGASAWLMADDLSSMASLDDISVFVVPLEAYRRDYIKWKQLRKEAAKEVERLRKQEINTSSSSSSSGSGSTT